MSGFQCSQSGCFIFLLIAAFPFAPIKIALKIYFCNYYNAMRNYSELHNEIGIWVNKRPIVVRSRSRA